MKYLEDFEVGQVEDLGSHVVTKEEILEFAEKWDWQRFHVDTGNSCENPFGELIASGWHTTSIFMRLYVGAILENSWGAGSPGVDELRWTEPVRPGDTLTARLTVESIIPSLQYRDRGTVKPKCELINQHGRIVLSMYLHSMFYRRARGN